MQIAILATIGIALLAYGFRKVTQGFYELGQLIHDLMDERKDR